MLLSAACLTLGCLSAHRPRVDLDRDSHGPTFADGAREWRLMTLRDASGRIPEDALQRARAHVQRMRRGRMGPEPAPATGADQTAGGVSTIQAGFERENWRWLGPGNIGGRLRSIVIHPTRPSTVFAGSVAGGIWRSDDGAGTWRPVDDFMTNLAISSLAINPRNPDEMYAGTGETFGNADSIRGAGLFKSVDGGVTWTQASSPSRGPWPDVRRVAVSPDGTILLAAGRNGLFRSTDGGATYLSIGQLSGSMAVAFHPTDSNRAILIDGGGLPRTTVDGGLTWMRGSTPYGGGRAEVVYSRSQPDTIYIAGVDGGIYVSHDGGLTFTQRYTGLPNTQTWYDLVIWCNPTNPNHLLWGAQSMFESVDGGASWRFVQGGLHEDQHVIVEDPRFDGTSNALVYVGNDGGVATGDARPGQQYNWTRRNQDLGVTQFYGAAGDPVTGEVIGGTQDNGTLRYRPAGGTNWSTMMGADGAFCAIDPTGTPAYYGETQYGRLARSIGGGTMLFIHSGITDVDNRHLNFVTPFILDPNNPSRLLFGGASLWRTENARADRPAWSVMKRDTADGFISAIAVAPGNPDIVWLAHGAGSIYKTTNGTAATPTWTRVTSVPGFTFATRITIDPTNSDIVYVSRGGFTTGNVSRSMDGGATWTSATGTGDTALPMVPVRDIEVDPFDPATIYAATEVGIFVSHTRGAVWEISGNGPANVSVDELFTMGKTLVAATHGRGLFALDLGPDPPAQLTPSPNPRTFPRVPVGGVNTQTVTLTNSGAVALSIQSMWTSTAGLNEFWLTGGSTCWNAVLPPGGSCQMPIEFRPMAGGSRTASFMIGSNAAGSPHSVTLAEDAAPAAGLPAPWASIDVGSVGTAGTASFSDGTFSAQGAGADIWGTSDAFHYVHRTLTGDGSITARVATIENTAAWTKMGVMIRGSLSSGAPYGLMLVSSGKGIAFQRRTADGVLATGTSGGAGSAPKWVRITRTGQVVAAHASDDGTQWTLIGQDTISLPSTALVGLVAHSHDVNQLATATFDRVEVTAAPPPPPPPPPPAGLPAGWTHADVGATGKAGSATVSGSTFSVAGAGADVWGTADAFHYAYRSLKGDGTIVARVATIENVNAWTKAGVMIRASVSPSAAQAFMLVAASATKGVPFQRRVSDGGVTTSTSGSQSTAPRWIKLVRAGAVISGYESADGANWTLVASDTFTMPADVLVGLAVSSHVTGVNATATFDNVTVTTPQVQWSSADIGATGTAGAATMSGTTFTVSGAGADVWGTADAFHYAYRSLSGDGSLVARVATIENVNAWTKAGVMIRTSLSPSSAHAFMLVAASPTKGVPFQRRVSDGGVTTSTSGSQSTAPRWIKLVRAGNVISGYESADGANWTLVGSDTFAMPGDVLIGLAVSSHVSGVNATATFDNVTIAGGSQ